MLPVIGYPNLGPFLGPASSGARIAFKAHLVQVSDIFGLIEEIDFKLFKLRGETLYKAATCSGAICKAKALMAIRRLWLRPEGAA